MSRHESSISDKSSSDSKTGLYEKIKNYWTHEIQTALDYLVDDIGEITDWLLTSKEIEPLIKQVSGKKGSIKSSFAFQLRKNFNDFKNMRKTLSHRDMAQGWRGVDSIAREEPDPNPELKLIIKQYSDEYFDTCESLLQKLQICVHRSEVEEKENPISVNNLCFSFQNSIDNLRLETKYEAALYRHFANKILAELAPRYQRIDDLLAEEGIVLDSESSDAPPEVEKSKKSKKSISSNQNPVPKEFKAKSKGSKVLSEKNPPASLVISRKFELINLLHEYKHNTRLQLSQASQVLTDLKENLATLKISEIDKEIDQVSFIFNFIFHNKKLPDEIKSQLARLQIYVLMSAINEADFINQSSNPALQFLDMVVEHETGLANSQQCEKPGTQVISNGINHLLESREITSDTYTELLTQYQNHINSIHKEISEEKRQKQAEDARAKKAAADQRLKKIEQERQLKRKEIERLKKFEEEQQLKRAKEEERLKRIEDERLKKAKKEEQLKQAKEEEKLRRIEEERLKKAEKEEQLKQAKEEEKLRRIEEERLKKAEKEEQLKQAKEEEKLRRIEEERLKKAEKEEQLKQAKEEEKLRRIEEERLKKAEKEEQLKQASEEEKLKRIEERRLVKAKEDKLKRIQKEKQLKKIKEQARLKYIREESLKKQEQKRSQLKASHTEKIKRLVDSKLEEITIPLLALNKSFILFEKVWSPLLLQIALADGIKSSIWAKALRIIRNQVWSLIPKSTSDDLQKLIAIRSHIANSLVRGMHSLKLSTSLQKSLAEYLRLEFEEVIKQSKINIANNSIAPKVDHTPPPPHRDDSDDALIHDCEDLRYYDSDDSSLSESEDSVSSQFDDDTIIKGPEGKIINDLQDFSASMTTGSYELSSEMLHALNSVVPVKNQAKSGITTPDKVKKGDWIEFNEGTKVIMAKLIWKAADRSLYIFVNSSGERVKEIDGQILNSEIESGSIKLIKASAVASKNSQFSVINPLNS